MLIEYLLTSTGVPFALILPLGVADRAAWERRGCSGPLGAAVPTYGQTPDADVRAGCLELR
ncbi:uncharacterized protein B0H18DRAFT_536553 [Fomitopsis serialis]|uniref:uncharacterized protein n=1 Tax=Fomitopsis serialis TaxID=139415 RepID=UPI00200803E9|nr:uncharacterized protein B0H18DRAFT_536553 [Neoantrodia serialis]KAH9921753.1 hypothetical protein B0H18DRAFT_536553 [Neoantrodia serialis]